MNYSLRSTLTATVAAGAILSLSAALSPASASTIGFHNGTSDSFPAGNDDVNVFLDDEGFFLNIFSLCESEDHCLTKVWLEGSVGDTHLLEVDGFQSEEDYAVFEEFVFNDTGVPWTDYHVAVDEGFFSFEFEFEFGFEAFVVDWAAGEPTVDDEGLTVEFGENGEGLVDSLWFFFDEPLQPFDFGSGTGQSLFFAALLFPLNDTVTITQHPSIGVPEPASLALFGFGLLGLGAMRRRRRKIA